jgi:cobalt/nickel transport system ATP-binding protein
MLKIRNLSVTYPDSTVAVDRFDLTIHRGERVALIGANGAGKTSLLLALVGILPSTGAITVDGITLTKQTVSKIRTKIGVVFQNPDDQLIFPTIYDDIAFGPRNLGLDEETVHQRVEEQLDLLHIRHLEKRTALKLSGGEKRLAALATVLAMNPSMLVLDEPTAFLDPKARRNLIHILKSLPHTMLIATHDLLFAAEVCPRSVLIRKGSLFADGASEYLLYDKQKMDEGGVEAIGVKEDI